MFKFINNLISSTDGLPLSKGPEWKNIHKYIPYEKIGIYKNQALI